MPSAARAALGTALTRKKRHGRPLPFVPPEVDPHPDLVIRYSTSNTRSSPTVLHGATIIGTIYVHLSNNEDEIAYVSWFLDHTGDLPAVGSETTVDSFVRSDATVPYDMMGGTSTATAWVTTVDPAGKWAAISNNRTAVEADGSHTVTVRAVYTDTTTANFTATFTLDNDPTPPTPPAIPTGLAATTPAANTIFLDWAVGSGGDATVSYEYRINEIVNPPTTSPVAVTPSEVTLTGLTASVIHYAQVRAVDAGGDRSDWSSAVSALPTGIIDPEPPPGGRIDGGTGRLLSHGTTQGAPHVNVPKIWQMLNLNPGAPPATTVNGMDIAAADARGAWQYSGNNKGSQHLFGPRVIITMPLAWRKGTSNRTNANLLNSQSYLSYLELKKTAEGFYDTSRYYKCGERIAQASLASVIVNGQTVTLGQGEMPARFIIRLGHEHNGPWYPWYSGVDSELIGTIPNAWDTDLGAGPIGDRGPTFARAFRNAVTNLRAGANAAGALIGNPTCGDDIVIDFNLAHPGANPDASPETLLRSWYPAGMTLATMTSWPGDDYVDTIGMDIYFSSSGKDISYTQDTAPTGSDLLDFLLMHRDLAVLHNRPRSYPECGVTMCNDQSDIGGRGGSDANAADWSDFVWDWINGDHVLNPTPNTSYWVHFAAKHAHQGGTYNYTPPGPAVITGNQIHYRGNRTAWSGIRKEGVPADPGDPDADPPIPPTPAIPPVYGPVDATPIMFNRIQDRFTI